ncbi:MAG TPA: N-acetylmuramic acid 6-phosphate etherase [Candidatus Bathyarchaeota archaeon]|nr:N-acetylmuramic acid 6-phosphate etherase [Candidatus Bathyarchaeota archaeon]
MTKLTEERNPVSVGIDAKPIGEILRIINDQDKMIPLAIEAEIPHIEKAAEHVYSTLREGGNVFLVGAGTSGRLCVLEASEIPPTFGLPSERIRGVIAGGDKAIRFSVEAAEDDRLKVGEELLGLGLCQDDMVIGVTASGSTPFVLGAVEKAREIGAKTVGVSCNHDTLLSEIVDVGIGVVVGAEIVAGSTRMRAGTAQKMVLNMITTTAMMKLGLVYDGYMVGVQASNSKLKERSKRMVSAITGASTETTSKALEASSWDIRVAIVHILTGLSVEEAKRRLGEQGIREIIGE